MFTGLVDDIGILEAVEHAPAGRTFRVRCRYDDLVTGESVALNGACLTVRECGPRWFTAAAVSTTLERTAMGRWEAGRRVNLERSLRMGDRLGGHLMQGHVDGVGDVRSSEARGDAWRIEIGIPADLAELVVPQGAIAVDGVSLTVNGQPATDVVQLSVIDYTLRHTTLGALRVGDLVHVEGDVIGKYVRRLLAPYISLTR